MTSHLQKVFQYLKNDEYTLAYKEITKLIGNSGTNPQYLTLKGFIELKLKKIDESKKSLKASLKIKQSGEAWRYLAEVYTHEKRFKKAFNAFNLALIKPKDVYSHKKILSLRVVLGDVENLADDGIIKDISRRLIQIKEEFKNPDLTEEDEVINTTQVENSSELYHNFLKNPNPVERSELTELVFILLKQHRFIDSLTLLQSAFFLGSLEETITHIVFFEWIEYLYQVLVEFMSLGFCMLSLKIVNAIRFIFLNYKNDLLDCVFYSLENEQYERIYDIGVLCLKQHPIYHKTERIKKRIIEKHPEYSLSMSECRCGKVNSKLMIFEGFFTGVNYLIDE